LVFTTHIFLFYFLPLVLLLYYLLPFGWRNLFLTLASYVFYGWWEPWFVLLMLFSTVLDYYCGKIISTPGVSERWRLAGLLAAIIGD
jgi:alginate O-acetyltransferase complex protein AlgI